GRMRGSAAVRDAGQFDRAVSTEDVESSLSDAVEDTFGDGAAAASHRGCIQASVGQACRKLPKHSAGRLGPQATRHSMRRCSAKEHGWLANGLEHHGMQKNMSWAHEVDLLALMGELLEARHARHALSPGDVVARAATLEMLLVSESLGLPQTAHALNECAVADNIDAHALRH
ncbi:unnamed protein product, partial [Prorocentrum cordatum]